MDQQQHSSSIRTALQGAQADVERFHQVAGQFVGEVPYVPKPEREEDLWYVLEAARRDLETHAKSARALMALPDQPVGSRLSALRAWLIQEETGELLEGMQQGDAVAVADALGDLLYVVIGTAVSFGIDLEPVWNEIQRSNMAKFPECQTCQGCGLLQRDGMQPIRCDNCRGLGREAHVIDGKVQKPEGWTAPNIAGVLQLMRERAGSPQTSNS